MSVTMTSSDLERRDARDQIFQADILNNYIEKLHTVYLLLYKPMLLNGKN